jgi:hypothetical protein
MALKEIEPIGTEEARSWLLEILNMSMRREEVLDTKYSERCSCSAILAAQAIFK